MTFQQILTEVLYEVTSIFSTVASYKVLGVSPVNLIIASVIVVIVWNAFSSR